MLPEVFGKKNSERGQVDQNGVTTFSLKAIIRMTLSITKNVTLGIMWNE
jgi:hypothetical protein